MANYSKILELISGYPTTVDLSTNTLVTQGWTLNAATGGGSVTFAAHSTTSTYSLVWPQAQAASSGYVLSNDGSGNLSWASGSSGSVTSVALADGSTAPIYAISNSPVTDTGTLTFTLNTQSANTVFAGPGSGSVAQPSFRSLVVADLPAIGSANYVITTNSSANGLAGVAPSSTSGIALISNGTSSQPSFGAINLASGSAVTGTLAITNGGTGQTSASAAFIALSPLTTAGDIIYENASPAPARLAIGTSGQVLTVSGGLPAWTTPASGSVTSVALSDASTSPIYSISGSPIINSGTLEITLETQSANTVFAGPSSGSAVQPAFRSLVSADIPSLSAIYVPQSEVGAISGVASLDSSGHIPLSQLPSSLVEYQGTWSAATNTPTLANGTGTSGYFYIVSAGGTVNFGAGDITFNAGDWVLYNGTIWEQAVQATVVQSVNGDVGVVTVNAINQLTGDVMAGPASGSASAVATISDSAVTAAKIATGAFDQVTITGGAGTSASVVSSPAIITSEIAGQNLSATMLVALRYALTGDAGSTPGQMWLADNGAISTASVVGLAYPAGSVTSGSAVTVVEFGLIRVPSHGFTTGVPLYLGSSGALTTTAPSSSGSAVSKVGQVKDANNIWVDCQVVGVN